LLLYYYLFKKYIKMMEKFSSYRRYVVKKQNLYLLFVWFSKLGWCLWRRKRTRSILSSWTSGCKTKEKNSRRRSGCIIVSLLCNKRRQSNVEITSPIWSWNRINTSSRLFYNGLLSYKWYNIFEIGRYRRNVLQS